MEQRVFIELETSSDGYAIDTGKYSEPVEDAIRAEAARLHFYADEFSGDQESFDATGRYLCGGLNGDTPSSCSKFIPDPQGSPVGGCTAITGDINALTGGCDFWRKFGGQARPELVYPQKLAPDGIYVEHTDGEGFSCSRCMHGTTAAQKADSKGRARWCRWFGMRVTDAACCKQNARYPVIIFEAGQAKLIETAA